MSCRKDAEKAIFDHVFTNYTDGMPTFRRVGLNRLEITQQAKNKSANNGRAQAMQIMRIKLKSIVDGYNGHIRARILDTDPYSPVSAVLEINPQYVDYVYNTQLKSAQKTDDLLSVTGNNQNNIFSNTSSNTSANLGNNTYAAPTVGYYTKFTS